MVSQKIFQRAYYDALEDEFPIRVRMTLESYSRESKEFEFEPDIADRLSIDINENFTRFFLDDFLLVAVPTPEGLDYNNKFYEILYQNLFNDEITKSNFAYQLNEFVHDGTLTEHELDSVMPGIAGGLKIKL